MKTNRYLLGFALLVVGTMPAFSQVSNDNEDEVYKIDEQTGRNDFVPGQVLVKFKDESPVTVSKARGMFRSVNNSAVDVVLKEFGVEMMDKLLPSAKPLKARRKARGFNGEMIEEKDLSQLYFVKTKSLKKDSTMMLVNKLKELGEVEFAEPNYKVYMTGMAPTTMPEMQAIQVMPSKAYSTRASGDVICADPTTNPLYSEQWGIKKLNVNELWTKPIINSKRPVIAILDTGVDITHPDLVDNIWTNTLEAEGEDDYDNDGNGFKSDVHGWDFINGTADICDYNSHGTHVAGIAAASNNEMGIIGANPQALIMPITVMQSDGTGDISVVVQGIQYAIDNGADIINMSLGTYAKSYALKQVLEHAYQTKVLVAAAGNDAKGLTECKCSGCYTMYPAGFSFVLGVQSGQDGVLDGFSNYDCNGPTYSEYGLDVQENYELIAPGTGIMSCVPYGKYKNLSGTSMSAPLVAGAISALKMVKEYDTQEIMWADLIHMDCDFLKTYNVTERPAEIEVLTLHWDDSEDGGNGDGYYDAGETVRFYPIVRTVWGDATNVKCHLEIGDEYEDASLIEIIQNDVDFGWHLSAYAYERSKNPIIFKISENCTDARHIKLRLTVTSDEAINSVTQDFVITVDNIIKLDGLINEDMTLTQDHSYLVSTVVGITEGATLTILPGTNVVFRDGAKMTVFGNLTAVGIPGNMISFSRHIGDGGNYSIEYGDNGEIRLEYCMLNDAYPLFFNDKCHIENCHFKNSYSFPDFLIFNRCVITDCNNWGRTLISSPYSNIVNNVTREALPTWEKFVNVNYINTAMRNDALGHEDDYIILTAYSRTPKTIICANPPYLGTAREDIVLPHILQLGHKDNGREGLGYASFGVADLSNILKEPVKEAHGIVWKVLIDGVDPQDEYEIMPVLGVGKHKFEVYFNRPMNKAKIPNVGFGVRSPYNQNAVDEDGSWNEEGTIYTAYKTITGRTLSDGRNRVYVWGAEDDEFFECPYENFRFRFDIQSAGSLATGFAAEAGMGRVKLTWNNDNNNFEDAMGFNIYRYTIDEEGKADTICINKEIVDIETTEYIDYNVTPRTTYHYLYRVLSTDLREYDMSNVVAATPLTSTLGDANGSGDVDVMDVVTTVNYVVGMDPKPFIFEAADVNKDLDIDVLDVVGIVNLALNQSSARAMTRDEAAQAVYTIENGVLYVETPVTLAGLQVQFAAKAGTDIKAAEGLNGFEQASAWLTDENYMLMAYSFGSKNLQPGKHALLHIGDAEMTDIRLGDLNGNFVKAVSGSGTTAIDKVSLTKTLTKAGVYNLNGQKVAGSADSRKLQHGVYIINGQKVVK